MDCFAEHFDLKGHFYFLDTSDAQNKSIYLVGGDLYFLLCTIFSSIF
jgi:hypothetical protein